MNKKDSITKVDSERKPNFFSRRVSVYLICLLFAGLFWVLHSLSKEYTITIRVPVSYSYLPEQKLIAVDLPDSVDATVIGSGFTIFTFQFVKYSSVLDFDAREARSLGKGDFALATNSHAERIEGAIGHGLKILRVMPDTIVLSFEGRAEKKVPIRPMVNYKCAPLFQIGDSIRTKPSFAVVSGADTLINRINFIETESKSYLNLNRPVDELVKLVLPAEFSSLTISPAMVQLLIPVGQYTEKKFSVTIETINIPPSIILKTFPDKVDVIFKVRVEDYASITADMFRVVADYLKVKPKENTLKIDIARQPLNIQNLKMQPERVEFLIRK